MKRIARFEAGVERLLEGTFARLFAGRIPPSIVAAEIARALEDGQVVSPEGVREAPTHYWIRLSPADHQALAVAQPHLNAELVQRVAELAALGNLSLRTAPSVFLLEEPGLQSHEVRVEARWLPDPQSEVEGTHEMRPSAVAPVAPSGNLRSARPFLVVGGQRNVQLVKSTVTIGRGLGNDVIIEDARVSRQHAQLRQRYDRYVLYDLGSRSGTRINGYPVEECVLHSGDVISFGGIDVVYGEEATATSEPADHGDTPPLSPWQQRMG